MIPHVISGNTISAFIGGDLKTIDSSHPNFATIKQRLREGTEVGEDLFDLAAALRRHLGYEDELVKVGPDGMTYNDRPINNFLTMRIIDLVRRGQPATPWINFFKRLQLNPDPNVRDELFDWLERGGMPITPDGYFLAYKKVDDDYTSFYDHSTINAVGTTIFLTEYDHDKARVCSAGLHFCSWDYLPQYHGNTGRVVVLKINPADVVGFQSSYTGKGRACRYMIVDEIPEDEAKHAFPAPVYSTAYDDDEGWFYDGYGGPTPEDTVATFTSIFGAVKAWTKRLLN
ncbi:MULTISPECIES: hypothetical protein [unclassified Mesorhizobium]|uniref:hypothetical protein n=1 Tax=unclassified Mesorhizobium TaxID=325217 RepID=UPI00112E5072|nr:MULTISPECIES: hypothetical protein [unclassified Mesorhizobium]TPL42560.1 hypothetical protein FJ961_07675 [Mesorhizobium sp. B2-4-5]TPL66560.1 hypothetical protein FJ949_09335 [Mesorhizobium sp. B2-4-1]